MSIQVVSIQKIIKGIVQVFRRALEMAADVDSPSGLSMCEHSYDVCRAAQSGASTDALKGVSRRLAQVMQRQHASAVLRRQCLEVPASFFDLGGRRFPAAPRGQGIHNNQIVLVFGHVPPDLRQDFNQPEALNLRTENEILIRLFRRGHHGSRCRRSVPLEPLALCG